MKIKRKRYIKRKTALVAIIAVLVVGTGYIAYAYHVNSWPFTAHANNTQLYGSQDTNPTTDIPQSSSSQSTVDTGSISSPKGGDTTNSVPDTNIVPTKPTGTFVSNHRPNLSGSPAPNIMSSTCHTAPGATCTVQFSKDGVVRSLPKKTTDSNGNTSWGWKLQDINLTSGEWAITAVATSGKKTAVTSDATSLTVEP